MKIARFFGGSAALCALAVAGVLYAENPARSFDLQTSPTVVARPAADITDTYFFPSPTNPDNVVAVMDVYPLIPAGAGFSTYFDQKTLYTMHFDNKYGQEATTTSGARPIDDEVIQFSFAAPSGGTQQLFVYGPATPTSTSASTQLVEGGTYEATGYINRPFTAESSFFNTTPFSVFAGARRDPSFFNAAQFFQIFPDRNEGSTAQSCLPGGADTCPGGFTTSGDSFANTNVLSIAVEIPKTEISAGNGGVVAYWATTSSQSGQ